MRTTLGKRAPRATWPAIGAMGLLSIAGCSQSDPQDLDAQIVVEHSMAAAPVRPAGAEQFQPAPAAPDSPIPVADAGPARPISYDHLSLGLKAGDRYRREMLTPEVKALDGRRVRIYGFINSASTYVGNGINHFTLTRDSGECCYGPRAVLDHLIQVTLVPGQSARYSTYPVLVEGTFRLEEIEDTFEPGGNPQIIYQITATLVE
jgi:hypothetical protein